MTQQDTSIVLRNSHCSWCGRGFPAGAPWPRQCTGCGRISYLNPLPVAVLLVPVDAGVLVVRRRIGPGSGQLALPGGFINLGETWQEAAVRELDEETGVSLPSSAVRLHDVRSAPDGTVLVFGHTPRLAAAELPPSRVTDETDGWQVLYAPEPLAFSLHTEIAARFLSGDGAS